MRGYDEKCLELANHFLPECKTEDAKELAQWIQDAIEDWLEQKSKVSQPCKVINFLSTRQP